MPINIIPDSLANSPSGALAVLAAMITPALLLSACGTFILSTSNRLGRVIDRIRALSVSMEQIMQEDHKVELLEERRKVIFDMIAQQSARAKLLARGLMIFYIAGGFFVATSVAIGIVSVYHRKQAWIPLFLGITGAILLFYGSVVLIFEARRAVASLRTETEFLSRLVGHHYKERAEARLSR